MATTTVPALPSRADFALRAQRLTEDLAWLRELTAGRAGAANAKLMHDDAAGALHRLLAAAGAYEAPATEG